MSSIKQTYIEGQEQRSRFKMHPLKTSLLNRS